MLKQNRVFTLVSLFLGCVVLVLFVPPIPQSDAYHRFVDSRLWLGIPNFGNVISNAGFFGVGSVGMIRIFRAGLFDTSRDRIPYSIFFIGVTLVGAGSGFYHWAPSNETLFWDRLPITIAFMSLFAAIIADRIDTPIGIHILLPVMLIAGALSLLYWQQSEAAGAGDLRAYAMVQFFPILAIPIIFLLFRDYRYTEGRPLLWAIAWYAIAKLLEHFDSQIFELLGGSISGHSLKHLAAAVATLMILWMLEAARKPATVSGCMSK